MPYQEDDMLMLSGIQHYVFCPRQWALIHLEQQWKDNGLTAEGNQLHKIVDDSSYRQLNGGVITIRGVHLSSYRLGLYGVADAIELHPATDRGNAITHPRYHGRFMPYLIEYKHGTHKTSHCDIVQVVAQAMCMEEMHGIVIPEVALFYWKNRRREEVVVTQELRDEVQSVADEMHQCYATKRLPKAVKRPQCNKCSLLDICLPQCKTSVSSYLKELEL